MQAKYTLTDDTGLIIYLPQRQMSNIAHRAMLENTPNEFQPYGDYMAYAFGSISMSDLRLPDHWNFEKWTI